MKPHVSLLSVCALALVENTFVRGSAQSFSSLSFSLQDRSCDRSTRMDEIPFKAWWYKWFQTLGFRSANISKPAWETRLYCPSNSNVNVGLRPLVERSLMSCRKPHVKNALHQPREQPVRSQLFNTVRKLTPCTSGRTARPTSASQWTAWFSMKPKSVTIGEPSVLGSANFVCLSSLPYGSHRLDR